MEPLTTSFVRSVLRWPTKSRYAGGPEGARQMSQAEAVQRSQKLPKLPRACPRCGNVEHLYRTPRGLMCGDCVRTMDSAGLGFR
jgi:ribosomal protein S27AE